MSSSVDSSLSWLVCDLAAEKKSFGGGGGGEAEWEEDSICDSNLKTTKQDTIQFIIHTYG